jgi:hypothetical protein
MTNKENSETEHSGFCHLGASDNFLTTVGRVTRRGAMVKEIAASGDAVYNQNAVTGGSHLYFENLDLFRISDFDIRISTSTKGHR